MTSLILAWLVGEGIMSYRIVTTQKRPPLPGEILGTSGLFVALALLGEAQPQLAGLLAWGIDLAGFMALATTLQDTKTKAAPKKPATAH